MMKNTRSCVDNMGIRPCTHRPNSRNMIGRLKGTTLSIDQRRKWKEQNVWISILSRGPKMNVATRVRK